MLPHSRLHTDAPSQLAVPDPQTYFLRANAGHLGAAVKSGNKSDT